MTKHRPQPRPQPLVGTLGPYHRQSLALRGWRFPGAALARLWQTLLTWQERASSRHRLALMGEHELKDIGISRCDAERETDKPFWRG